MDLNPLAEWWCRLFPGKGDEAFDSLVRAYSEPSRHYHTLAHIADVLETIDRLHPAPPLALVLAAWFHDVVYDSRAGDNEERSAERARQVLADLAVSAEVRDETARLILLTKSHTADSDDRSGQVLLDADLAILGATAALYDQYAAAIRREYAWVSEPDYRAGRRAVLEKFLARPQLYFTPPMAQAEKQARANLAREIQLLS
jgi:predicted metal-dependent HD superfamily phosphohydrolase